MTPNTVRPAFEVWGSPTLAELETLDPMLMLPRVMAGYSKEQGELLRHLTKNVTELSDQIAEVSDYMNVVNTAMGAVTSADAGTRYYFKYFATEAEAIAEVARWVNIGAQPKGPENGATGVVHTDGVVDPTDPTKVWGVFLQKDGATAIQGTLRNIANDLTTANQQAQLELQTLMGRYNATIDVISSIIKKNASQLDAILNNYRR